MQRYLDGKQINEFSDHLVYLVLCRVIVDEEVGAILNNDRYQISENWDVVYPEYLMICQVSTENTTINQIENKITKVQT